MLIRQGDDRDSRLDRNLAFVLAAVAGGLNAAAFHEVGFFSANMTGNVSALSSLLTLGQWGHGLGYLAIVFAFIVGAMVSTLAISAGLRRGVVTIYARVILVEAACLILLGAARVARDRATGVPGLNLGLTFLMGLQNAIVTHISRARVRTTHVSGMSTVIGTGLARMIDILRGKADQVEREGVMVRFAAIVARCYHFSSAAWLVSRPSAWLATSALRSRGCYLRRSLRCRWSACFDRANNRDQAINHHDLLCNAKSRIAMH